MADATATKTASEQSSKIEDVGPARKRITITIPVEVIRQRMDQSLGTLANEAALPGFRKGRAPRKLLERRFGSSIKTETKNQLIANAYAAVVEENQLKPLGEPEPVDGLEALEVEPDKPFTFSIEVEVMPTFDLPSFDGIEIKKPMLEITDEHIDNELKRQQVLYGTAQKIEGEPQEGDYFIGQAAVTKNDEDKPFFRDDQVGVVYPKAENNGRGHMLGLMIDGLRDTLKGKNIGDRVTIETVGPDAHERVDLRGAKIRIDFEIRDLERIEPATPDIVAERYGLPSGDVLREQIKVALEHRRDNEQSTAMREQATNQLADRTEIDLPEQLTSSQAARSVEQLRLQLLSQGLSPDEAEVRLAEVRGDSEEHTRKRLKKFFLLQRLSEHYQIDVSEQEINARIASIAAQRNIRPDKLRSELVQAGRLGEVSHLVRDEKAANRLVQEVKQVEVSADEWNMLFKGGADKKSSPAKKESSPKPASRTRTPRKTKTKSKK